MAADDRIFFVPEEVAATPASGEAVVGNWWVVHPGKGLAFWFDPERSGLRPEPMPQANPDEAVARRLGPLTVPGGEVRQVPVVFMAHAVREAGLVMERARAERERVREERAEMERRVPAVGTPEWADMARDSVRRTAPNRTVAQREVLAMSLEIEARHKGVAGVPLHEERDGRLALLEDGALRCVLTPRDWQLYHGTKDCREAAAALNAAFEKSHRDGTDPFDALSPVMEAYARYGADDTEPRSTLADLSETVSAWRASAPRP